MLERHWNLVDEPSHLRRAHELLEIRIPFKDISDSDLLPELGAGILIESHCSDEQKDQ
jgi:hypothetical protein